ncbi:hypothetical protein FQN54_008624 [Arachnomyces sp. PD_36]|nr:hypothetical protein FQN54_008624 [Arachnomyces sp. PD_36]
MGDFETGPRKVKHVLYIDAYDSFAQNIISLVQCSLGVTVTPITIDFKWPGGDMVKYIQQYDAIVVGPGPGNPTNDSDVGIIKDLWGLSEEDTVPILGICLGFQSLCHHFGAGIKRLPEPRHGCVESFAHSGRDMFKNIPEFKATLYHSLQVEIFHSVEKRAKAVLRDAWWNSSVVCPKLEPLAWFISKGSKTENNLMAARLRHRPFWGVQFHPESCMSDKNECVQLIKNWWALAKRFNTERNIRRFNETTISRTPHIPDKAPPIVSEMLHLSSTATNSLHYKSLSGCRLPAEIICEIVDIPNIPSVVLESNGRYSIISVPSPGSWRVEYSVAKRSCHLARITEPTAPKDVPLAPGVEIWDVLRDVLIKKQVTSGNQEAPFWGGFMGLFSYEAGLEKWGLRTPEHADKDGMCDISLLWVERSIVIDKQTGMTYIQSTRDSDEVQGGWLDSITQRLQKFSCSKSLEDILLHMTVSCQQTMGKKDFIRLLRNSDGELVNLMVQGAEITQPNEEAYKSRIKDCQEEIRAGESYELCLTDETKVSLPLCAEEEDSESRPWVLYKRLRKYNPASFSAYAKLGNLKIISSSPECFLQWDRKDTLEMKPMKGTVKKTARMTLKKAQDILRTPKEMGENLMIADLIRHDLFTVCGAGGVTVDKLMEVEDHTRVYQLVTHILGKVPKSLPPPRGEKRTTLKSQQSMSAHGCKALSICLPPGSMTGAPKKRSCELLSRIENRSRSAYSGAMGYLDVGGGGSFSVLIRMAYSWSPPAGGVDGRETWRIGAGGAVTHLSTPQGEWDEMETKLNTVLEIFRPIVVTESGDVQAPELLRGMLEKRKQEREEMWDRATSARPPSKGCPENGNVKMEASDEVGVLKGNGVDKFVQVSMDPTNTLEYISTKGTKRKRTETINGTF